MPAPIVRTLDLRADLSPGNGESITVYELADPIGFSPDPSPELYSEALRGAPANKVPAGKYLFYQADGAPEYPILAEEALEVQREGLWRGLRLSPRLYLRVLSEERGIVRQLLRGIAAEQ